MSMCVWCPWWPEEGLRYPGAEVMGDCEHTTWVLGIELMSSGSAKHIQQIIYDVQPRAIQEYKNDLMYNA